MENEDTLFCDAANMSEEQFYQALGGFGRYVVLVSERGRLRKLKYDIPALPAQISPQDIERMKEPSTLTVEGWAVEKLGFLLRGLEVADAEHRQKVIANAIDTTLRGAIAQSETTLRAKAQEVLAAEFSNHKADITKMVQEGLAKIETAKVRSSKEVRSLADELRAVLRK
jgi:hypothetical protein